MKEMEEKSGMYLKNHQTNVHKDNLILNMLSWDILNMELINWIQCQTNEIHVLQ